MGIRYFEIYLYRIAVRTFIGIMRDRVGILILSVVGILINKIFDQPFDRLIRYLLRRPAAGEADGHQGAKHNAQNSFHTAVCLSRSSSAYQAAAVPLISEYVTFILLSIIMTICWRKAAGTAV